MLLAKQPFYSYNCRLGLNIEWLIKDFKVKEFKFWHLKSKLYQSEQQAKNRKKAQKQKINDLTKTNKLNKPLFQPSESIQF